MPAPIAPTTSRIWTPIDFDADGKKSDCLRLPYSCDLSAYGFVPIPVTCIRNGSGPTALLVAGNHGDEYEGQVALMKLARMLDPENVSGRIFILPALNFPAVDAGRRVSPLDNGNLNRLFPGDPAGTPTQMIAHFVSDVLLPMAHLVVDLHSGGRSLDYIPSALVKPGRTPGETTTLRKLLEIFGAPVSFISDGAGGGGATTLAAAAQHRNVPALTAELGGSATLSGEGLSLAIQGTLRLLKSIGIVKDIEVDAPKSTRLMRVPGRSAFIYSTCRGIFEPLANPGDEVQAGQKAGSIHPIGWPQKGPTEFQFPAPGLVACRRAPALTEPGDCLFKLMVDIPG